MRVTADDYMTTEIIDMAYENQVYLKDKFLEMLGRIVLLSKPDTSKGIYTIPFADFINIIEENINALIRGGYIPSGMKNTVNWKGELNDLKRLSYLDINRWFETFEQLEKLIYSIVYRTLITGAFSTGNDRTRQLIRTVN